MTLYTRFTPLLSEATRWAANGSYHETGALLEQIYGGVSRIESALAELPWFWPPHLEGGEATSLSEVIDRENAVATLLDTRDREASSGNWPGREAFSPLTGHIYAHILILPLAGDWFVAGYGRSRIAVREVAGGYEVAVCEKATATPRGQASRNRAVRAFGEAWVEEYERNEADRNSLLAARVRVAALSGETS